MGLDRAGLPSLLVWFGFDKAGLHWMRSVIRLGTPSQKSVFVGFWCGPRSEGKRLLTTSPLVSLARHNKTLACSNKKSTWQVYRFG